MQNSVLEIRITPPSLSPVPLNDTSNGPIIQNHDYLIISFPLLHPDNQSFNY